MKQIRLGKNKFSLVDDEDYERLNQHKWYAHKENKMSYYAVRQTSRALGAKRFQIRMHREVLGIGQSDKRICDHINGDTLDNRRCNLRLATFAQNMFNTAKRTRIATSKYKGVSWSIQTCNGNGKWRAQIRYNKRFIHVGMFVNEIEAAKAYDKAAKKYFGEFARLNNVA
jgi:hypothetical protein